MNIEVLTAILVGLLVIIAIAFRFIYLNWRDNHELKSEVARLSKLVAESKPSPGQEDLSDKIWADVEKHSLVDRIKRSTQKAQERLSAAQPTDTHDAPTQP